MKKKREMHTKWSWLCQCLCSESLSGRTLRWKRDALRLGTLGLTLRRSAFSSLYDMVERNEEILTSLKTEAGDNRGGWLLLSMVLNEGQLCREHE